MRRVTLVHARVPRKIHELVPRYLLSNWLVIPIWNTVQEILHISIDSNAHGSAQTAQQKSFWILRTHARSNDVLMVSINRHR